MIWTAAALVLLAGALLARPSSGGGTGRRRRTGRARDELKGRARVLEEALSWPGLVKLVDATAATESGWNLRPYGRAPIPGSNAAVGPMQLRPRSGGDSDKMRALFLADPTYLEDSAIAVAAATAYWARLSDNNPNATFGDVRASFAFPVYIHGRPTKLIEGLAKATKHKTLSSQQQRYDDAIRNYRKALRSVRLPVSLVNAKAFPRVMKTNVMDLVALFDSPRGDKLQEAMG